jgi:hypothetical protein
MKTFYVDPYDDVKGNKRFCLYLFDETLKRGTFCYDLTKEQIDAFGSELAGLDPA